MAKKAPRKKSEHVARAKNIIRQKTSMPTDQEVLDLTRQLKQEKAFGYARKLLARADESIRAARSALDPDDKTKRPQADEVQVGEAMDEASAEIWMREVQTTPAAFLKAISGTGSDLEIAAKG